LRKNSSDGGGPGPVFRSIAVAHIEQKTIARIFCFVTFQGYRDFFKRSFKLSAIMTGMRSPDFFPTVKSHPHMFTSLQKSNNQRGSDRGHLSRLNWR
jgi:hypothetical protein